ncbi:hypothetical protein TNCV_1708521 [Trichonephila clavipes]|nr:hypothetical protein TNCV_1708521 [Trichonephila clavipes]
MSSSSLDRGSKLQGPRREESWGFGGPVLLKTLKEEEVEVEPVVTYNCDYCEYRSRSQKGLRCHRSTEHRSGGDVLLGHPRAPP